MDKIKKILNKAEDYLNLSFSEKQIDQFQVYAEMLVDWNKKINLTSIVDFEEIVVKHFVDSLTLTKYVKIKEQDSVIDIGTGAGFPGIPIKIMNNSINLTLLDSLNKRLVFLKELLSCLGLDANIVHLRAEDGGRQKFFREKFDIVTSRAVAKLNVLSELCLPYVKVNGFFVSMKGDLEESEIERAKGAIDLLGGKIEKVERFVLPNRDKRSVVIIKKIKETPNIYPRIKTKISKKPLD